jgi:hypothetical protein
MKDNLPPAFDSSRENVVLYCTADGRSFSWDTRYLSKLDGIRMMKMILGYVHANGVPTPDAAIVY